MYPKAVELGIDADRFWEMTYDEIIVQAEANKKIKEREVKEKAMLDYKAAQLQAYAFNDPKKMPKFEAHYQFAEQKPMNEENVKCGQQDWRLMKARMQERAMLIKATREKQLRKRSE